MSCILRILMFKFLRYPPCKGFWDFVKERFSWSKNGFIVFKRYDLVEKSVARYILGWNFLNKTSNLNFAFRVICMGNRAKSDKSDDTFVLRLGVQKQNYLLRILKLRFLRVPLLRVFLRFWQGTVFMALIWFYRV
jgi:hypothetical protein